MSQACSLLQPLSHNTLLRNNASFLTLIGIDAMLEQWASRLQILLDDHVTRFAAPVQAEEKGRQGMCPCHIESQYAHAHIGPQHCSPSELWQSVVQLTCQRRWCVPVCWMTARLPSSRKQSRSTIGMSCSWMSCQCGALWVFPLRKPKMINTYTFTHTRALKSITMATG